MFSILIIGLLVVIALTVFRNSANHRASNARREARAQAFRDRRETERAQVAAGMTAMERMAERKRARTG